MVHRAIGRVWRKITTTGVSKLQEGLLFATVLTAVVVLRLITLTANTWGIP